MALSVVRLIHKETNMLTQKLVKDRYIYNNDTGELHSKMYNRVVGSKSKRGYLQISINKKTYLVHRIIWLYVHGVMPETIDHINHIKDDNRLINLRNATQSQNTKNKSLCSNNTSGHNGVVKKGNRWTAFVMQNKKRIFLGSFATVEEAVQARKLANVKYGFHENHGTTP